MEWYSVATDPKKLKSQHLAAGVDHFLFDFTRYTIKAPICRPNELLVE